MNTNVFWGVTVGTALLFTAAHGQFAWAHRIASTLNPSDELAIGLALDRKGNCHVTGWFDGTNDFGGVVLTNQAPGGQDMFVAKSKPAVPISVCRPTASASTSRGSRAPPSWLKPPRTSLIRSGFRSRAARWPPGRSPSAIRSGPTTPPAITDCARRSVKEKNPSPASRQSHRAGRPPCARPGRKWCSRAASGRSRFPPDA